MLQQGEQFLTIGFRFFAPYDLCIVLLGISYGLDNLSEQGGEATDPCDLILMAEGFVPSPEHDVNQEPQNGERDHQEKPRKGRLWRTIVQQNDADDDENIDCKQYAKNL